MQNHNTTNGTGQNCANTKLHENKVARRQFCTKGQFCTSYIFARVKKNTEKIKIKKKNRKQQQKINQ